MVSRGSARRAEAPDRPPVASDAPGPALPLLPAPDPGQVLAPVVAHGGPVEHVPRRDGPALGGEAFAQLLGVDGFGVPGVIPGPEVDHAAEDPLDVAEVQR